MSNEGGLLAERYRLVSQAGAGAMGVVWKAQDERLGRVVAVKQMVLREGGLDTDPETAKARVMREGRLAARLHQQHAIKVYDVVEEAGTPYLIMEYLESESLSALMTRRGPLPAGEVARIGGQIAGALAVAHEAGIVHRDVKPGNVLVAEDGTAKITDFGISHAVGDVTMTATGIFAGTPAYLAPEVARGQKADYAADVFSLGATLYAAVEGTPPFGLDENALALVFRVASNEITPPTHAGPITPVLLSLLEADPARRPTMRQAAAALSTASESGGSTTRAFPVPAGPTAPAGATSVLETPVPAGTASTGTAPTNTAPTNTLGGPPRTRYGPGPVAVAGGAGSTAPHAPSSAPPQAYAPPQGPRRAPPPGGTSATTPDAARRKRLAMIALAAFGLVAVVVMLLVALFTQGDDARTPQAPRPQAPPPTSTAPETTDDTGTVTTRPSPTAPAEVPGVPSSQAPAPTTGDDSPTPSPSSPPEPTTTDVPTPTDTPSQEPPPTGVPTGAVGP